MTTWLVTRHRGAVLWARKAGVKVSNRGIVADLDISKVKSGDLVVGTLPVNIASQVVMKGASYRHLALDVPMDFRGKELSVEDMDAFGARLEEYEIQLRGTTAVADTVEGAQPVITLCIASGEAQPNIIPLLATPSTGVFVAVSSDAKAKQSASRLQDVCTKLGIPVHLKNGMPDASFAEIKTFAEKVIASIRRTHPDAQIELNVTGGTKMMALAFMEVLGPVGRAVYCDTAHGQIECLRPEHAPARPIPPGLLDVQIMLFAQGLAPGETKSTQPEWMARARRRITLSNRLRKLAAQTPHVFGALARLGSFALEQSQRGKKTPVFVARHKLDARFVNDSRYAQTVELAESLGIWTRHEGDEVVFADPDAANYLKGEWIEELLAVEVGGALARAGVPDSQWACGMHITPLDAAGKAHDKYLNELDFALVWRNRLLVIECKTGAQVNNSSEDQNIVNKLDAISRYIGGPLSQKWLASARLMPPETTIHARSERLGVALFQPADLVDLPRHVLHWAGLGPAVEPKAHTAHGARSKNQGKAVSSKRTAQA